MIRVVGAQADVGSVEVSVSQDGELIVEQFDGAGVEQFFPDDVMDGDGVLLQWTSECCGEWRVSHLVDGGLGGCIEWNNDGSRVVFDDFEKLGHCAEGKPQIAFVGLKLFEDVFFVELFFALGPVVRFEVFFDGLQAEDVVGVMSEDFLGDLGGLAEEPGGELMGGSEDVDVSCGAFAFAIASACSLGDGVESCDGSIDDGEVDIDAGFDHLGADDTAGQGLLQTVANDV